jgi:hypothetical protein
MDRSFRHTLARISFLFVSHLHSPGGKKAPSLGIFLSIQERSPNHTSRQQFVAVISLFKQQYGNFSSNFARAGVRFNKHQ